jgi:hypothetical protein
MVLVGAFVTFGCEGVEQAKGISAGESLKVLPAHGLSDAEPLRAGLALGAYRLAQCKDYEERRAREEKWPPITVPDQPVKLRSKPINARLKEVDSVVMKYNYNLDDNQQQGCFINAFQDNQDGTVTDYATQIMWKQLPSPATTCSSAENFIHSLNEKNTLVTVTGVCLR